MNRRSCGATSDKQVVKILIIGLAKSGKSTLTQLIEEALAFHHIEVKSYDGDERPAAVFRGKTIDALAEKVRIEIKTVQMARKPKDFKDPCPECGTQLKTQPGGGVKCPKCDYWFCY
jgi:tRNA(Ile2) C34 agmatinyltransferase TiaS